MLGIACTGIALFPDWLNQHPARKVILHRPAAAVDASLEAIGLPGCGAMLEVALQRIVGWHLDWTDLWHADRAEPIWQYLLHKPFDFERWDQLRQMRIQPDFERVDIDLAHTQRMVRAIAGAA